MGDRENQMPEIIRINDRPYKYTTVKILNKYDNGVTPEDCTVIPDDQICELVGTEEFMICYIPLSFFPEEEKGEAK